MPQTLGKRECPLLIKQLVVVLGLIQLVAASVIPDVDPSTASINQLSKRDDPPWPYAVIGDSWGSGVAYNDDVLYDGNLDDCIRTKESHGPQLEGDNTWIGDTSGLKDAACSGSFLGDLAKGKQQIKKVGNPDLVVMTSGGNNAHFGTIAENCFYHPKPREDYGPIFTDITDKRGNCSEVLNFSLGYITGDLERDLRITINDILADPSVKDNPNFLLYVTGYAQFFGTDIDDWCNTEAWNIPGISATPYLTKALRTEVNKQISMVNTLYQNEIQANFSKQARYIDLDTRFSGHRFCEPGSNRNAQFNTDTHFEDVYLWNLNWPWQVANQPPPNSDENNGQISADEAQQLFGDSGVTAWSGTGGNKPENGWMLRPFHPRYSGYTRIKDAILAQMKKDGLPPSPPSSTTSPTPPAPSCSHVGDGFHCQCTDGSTPDIDEDNRCCLYHQPNGNDMCFNG